MTLRYYMDHHVPEAITSGLRRLRVDCMTAFDDGRAGDDDPDLMQRASDLDRVMFSMDEDSLVIAAQWMAAKREFAGLVYAHQLQITIGQAIRDLQFMSEVLDPPDMRNWIERLPL